MPIVKQEKTAQNSTNDYVSLLKVKIEGIVKASVIITNSDTTNSINYKMLYSNDPEGAVGSWYEKQAETAIVPYASDPANAKNHDIDPTPLWIDIQIQSTVPDSVGIGNAWMKIVGL